jgi:broad specificity phosphatase PhoE
MARAKQAPPSSTLFLLVRHGLTPTTGKVLPGRAPGLHLADTGQSQANAAAERIAALKTVDAVYASPLERARETAAPIAKAKGLKVQIDKGLLECDFGEWTGAELKS